MSRATYATAEQIKDNFRQCIKDALELGLWPPSDQGFNNETNQALTALAKAYPKADGKLVKAAKNALASQLAGKTTTTRKA